MLAAADNAEDPEGCAPPPTLSLAWNCQQWHTLPDAGGLMDQPAGLIARMNVALNIHAAFTGFRHAEDGAQWRKDNPGLARLIMQVGELRNG